MSIVPEWDLTHFVKSSLDVLAAELESPDRECRITAAVNLIDNCLRILKAQGGVEELDDDEEDDDD